MLGCSTFVTELIVNITFILDGVSLSVGLCKGNLRGGLPLWRP
jgi:hypothetical protein